MIELRSVSKTFRTAELTVEAVRDADLKVNRGEIHGVIGFSGAGKSTLLRLINRLEEADRGEILYDLEGELDILQINERELRRVRRSMGMIFQHFNLMPSRTVLDNVCFPLRQTGLSKAEQQSKARELLRLVDIADKELSYPSELSGGQKQRVGIARALSTDPQILLCDEATSALDPQTTQQILALLKRLNRELGLTIILITHEMFVVKELCHTVSVMHDGWIVEQGSVFEIFSKPQNEITQNFIRTTSNLQKINQLLEDDAAITRLAEDERIIQFRYIDNTVAEPLVSSISRRFGIDVNILFSDLEIIQDMPIGGLVCIVKGEPEAVEEALDYWQSKGILAETLKPAGLTERDREELLPVKKEDAHHV